MKKIDYLKSLELLNEILYTNDGHACIPVAHSITMDGDWLRFDRAPAGLLFASLKLIMEPGVTLDNGKDWYENKMQMNCAMAVNYSANISAIDLPVNHKHSLKRRNSLETLAYFHRQLTPYERSQTLSNYYTRVADFFGSVKHLPYCLQVCGVDEPYYEYHCLTSQEVAIKMHELLSMRDGFTAPYTSDNTLEHGWTKY